MASGITHTPAGGAGTITTDNGKASTLPPHTPGELNTAPDRRAHPAARLRARQAPAGPATAAAGAESGPAGAA